MRYVCALIAVGTLALSAGDSLAQPPGAKSGQNSQSATGKPGGRRGSGARANPAQMAGRMMRQFDQDGDQQLNVRELTAMLNAFRDRGAGIGRGNAGKQAAAAGAGRAAKQPGGKNRRLAGSRPAGAGGTSPDPREPR